MERTVVEKNVVEAIAAILSVYPEHILTWKEREIGEELDSLDFVELLMLIEVELKIELGGLDVEPEWTVEQLIDHVYEMHKQQENTHGE